MGAISKRNFVMFQKLCGSAALANVVLATTRWSEVKQAVGESRETELKTKEAFFKPVIDAGAPLVRYMSTPNSTMEILNHLVGKPAIPLLIQQEMVDGGKRLSETEAGQALHNEIAEHVRQHEEDIRTLRKGLEGIKEDNDEVILAFEAEVKELGEKVSRLKEEMRKILLRSYLAPRRMSFRGKISSKHLAPPLEIRKPCPPCPPSRTAIGSPSTRPVNSSVPRPPSRNATPIPITPAGDGSIMSSNTPSSAPITPSANVRPSVSRSSSKNVPTSVNPSSHAPPSVPRPPSRNVPIPTTPAGDRTIMSNNTPSSAPVTPSANVRSSILRPPSKNVPASVNPSSYALLSVPRPPSRIPIPIPTTPAGDRTIMSSNTPSSAPIAPSANVRPSILRPPLKNVPASVGPSSHAPPSALPHSRNANTTTNVIPPSNPASVSIPPLPNPFSSVSRALSRKAPPSP